jgi:hypothetical protein
MFDNEKDCCDKHFSWVSDCVKHDATSLDSEESGPPLFYPTFDDLVLVSMMVTSHRTT